MNIRDTRVHLTPEQILSLKWDLIYAEPAQGGRVRIVLESEPYYNMPDGTIIKRYKEEVKRIEKFIPPDIYQIRPDFKYEISPGNHRFTIPLCSPGELIPIAAFCLLDTDINHSLKCQVVSRTPTSDGGSIVEVYLENQSEHTYTITQPYYPPYRCLRLIRNEHPENGDI